MELRGKELLCETVSIQMEDPPFYLRKLSDKRISKNTFKDYEIVV